jgi:hypothetical protein
MLQRLFFLVLAIGVALAGLALVPQLPQDLQTRSWPVGTQFALVDQNGQVVWKAGDPLSPGVLQKAVALAITLPDGTSYLVAVQVKGQGAGLGEVKLFVDGKLVPLPELLHAKGFTVENGQIVKVKPGEGEGKASGGNGSGQGASESHGQGKNPGQGAGRRP